MYVVCVLYVCVVTHTYYSTIATSLLPLTLYQMCIKRAQKENDDQIIEEMLEKELEDKRSVLLPPQRTPVVVTTKPIVRGFVSESFDRGVVCL